MKRLIAAIALACLFVGHANAAQCQMDNNGRTLCMNAPGGGDGARVSYRGDATIIGGRPAGCPHAYCGCGLAKYLGINDTRLNLAWNWARLFPRERLPRAGLAAVRRSHVMYIEASAGDGLWLIRDYNSGGRLVTASCS